MDTNAINTNSTEQPQEVLFYGDFLMYGSDWGPLLSSLLSYAKILQNSARYSEAVNLCNILLKYEEPNCTGGPFVIKIDCLEALGRYTDITSELEAYIASSTADQTLKFAHYRLGMTYVKLGLYDSAKAETLKAKELDPQASGPIKLLEEIEQHHIVNSCK